jgi:hypothetical protein
MFNGPDSTLKRCRRCQEIKKESQFRYIQHFKKHRLICKRCESAGTRDRKKLVEKHVQEHGVTPGILERIQRDTNKEASAQARKLVLSKLSRFNRIKYFVGNLLLWPCCYILFVLSFLLFPSLWLLITQGTSSDSVEILLAFGVQRL